jgi:glutamate dehydrogenase/leucine dehydrogenase
MDNAMADIQADDMKHGLYDECGLDNSALAELIAQKLLEVATMDDLETTYYECQKEWAESLSEDELLAAAVDLRIDMPATVVDELTEIAQKYDMGY